MNTKTVITIQGQILATGVSGQKASAVSRKHGDQPAGVYVIRGNVAAAKAAMARIAAPAVYTTDRIEAARMGVTL